MYISKFRRNDCDLYRQIISSNFCFFKELRLVSRVYSRCPSEGIFMGQHGCDVLKFSLNLLPDLTNYSTPAHLLDKISCVSPHSRLQAYSTSNSSSIEPSWLLVYQLTFAWDSSFEGAHFMSHHLYPHWNHSQNSASETLLFG